MMCTAFKNGKINLSQSIRSGTGNRNMIFGYLKWVEGKLNQNSVLPVSISVTKYRVTFLKNDKFGQKITENANNVKFVTKKRQLQ